MKLSGNEFQSALQFVETSLSDNACVDLFGYYGETSICTPRFFVAHGENSWEYTASITLVNKFFSFSVA